jgi:hypothetical protein
LSADPVREEAERLVAAAIGMLATASRSFSALARETTHGSGASPGRSGAFATGSDECCICPICRVIAAMREPDPDLAERLATGAGDLATAVASVLRSLSRAGFRGASQPGRDDEGEWPAPRAEPEAGDREPEDPWRAATAPPPRKPMAKKAVKKATKATKATKKATGGGGAG